MSVVNRMLYNLRARAVKTDDMPPLLRRLFIITQLRDDDNNVVWWKIIVPAVLLTSTVISATVLHQSQEEPIVQESMMHEPDSAVKTLAVLEKKEDASVGSPHDTIDHAQHAVILEQDRVVDDPIDQDRNEILNNAVNGVLDQTLPDESILEQQTGIISEPISPVVQTSVNEQMLLEGTTGHGVTEPQNEVLPHMPAFPSSLLDHTHHDYRYTKIHGLGEIASADISQPSKSVTAVHVASKTTVAEKQPIRQQQKPTKKQQSSESVVTKKRKRVIKKTLPLTAEEQSIAAYADAVNALAKGKVAGAEQHLYAALKHDSHNQQARETLAAMLINHRRLPEAQKILRQGIEVAPDYFPFSRWLARIYLENNESANALEVLEKGLDRFQDNADYLALLAVIYQQLGLHRDAIAFFQKAIELRPTESRWWLAIGLAYEVGNNWKAAKEAYVEAINTRQLQSGASKYVYDRLASVARKLPDALN